MATHLKIFLRIK